MGLDQPWSGPVIKGLLLQNWVFISLQLWQRASKKLIQLLLYLAGACCLTAIPTCGSEFQSVGSVTSSLHSTLFSSRHFCTLCSHFKLTINPSINIKKIKSQHRVSYFWGACHKYNQIICWKTEIHQKAESTGFKSLFSSKVLSFPCSFLTQIEKVISITYLCNLHPVLNTKKVFTSQRSISAQNSKVKHGFEGDDYMHHIFKSEIFNTNNVFPYLLQPTVVSSHLDFSFSHFQVMSKCMLLAIISNNLS